MRPRLTPVIAINDAGQDGACATASVMAAAASVPLRAEALVGATVAVWWGGDDAWYTGTVAKYCSSDKGGKNAGRHWIKYLDGDKKWHLLDYPFYEVRAAAARCL